MNRAIFLLFLLPLLSSCAMMAPSAKPEDAQRVLQLSDRYKQSGTKSMGATAQVRKPLRTGQWVATLSPSKSNPDEVTLQIMKVAAVDGSRVTLEMEQYASTTAGKRMVMQQTVKNYPVNARTAYTANEAAGALNDIVVERVQMMDDDQKVVTLPQLPFGIGGSASDLLKSVVATSEIRSEPCSNGIYRAAKCLLIPFQSRVLWMSDSGVSYAHSEVPVLGVLRSDTQNYTIETIGFGESGANILIRKDLLQAGSRHRSYPEANAMGVQ